MNKIHYKKEETKKIMEMDYRFLFLREKINFHAKVPGERRRISEISAQIYGARCFLSFFSYGLLASREEKENIDCGRYNRKFHQARETRSENLRQRGFSHLFFTSNFRLRNG